MNARIERDWSTLTVRVWLYERLMDGSARTMRHVEGDVWQSEITEPGAKIPEPSFVLPEDGLRALVAEASDFTPPSAALDAHLKDAVETRDRLLAIIENREPVSLLRLGSEGSGR